MKRFTETLSKLQSAEILATSAIEDYLSTYKVERIDEASGDKIVAAITAQADARIFVNGDSISMPIEALDLAIEALTELKEIVSRDNDAAN